MDSALLGRAQCADAEPRGNRSRGSRFRSSARTPLSTAKIELELAQGRRLFCSAHNPQHLNHRSTTARNDHSALDCSAKVNLLPKGIG